MKHRLTDVEPDALAVFNPKDKMYMGVRLIGMKRQRVSMVETERLSREASNGSKELAR
jgi:hypothetical protein